MPTYSELEDDDRDMLIKSEYPRLRSEFATYLGREASNIERLVAYHLSLKTHQVCKVTPRHQWMCGSFNICMPVTVKDWTATQVMLRFPLPHRFHSGQSSDTASEKIRIESATFAWISEHCPRVPIPRLLGFGLADGRSFTPIKQLPWVRRAYEWIKQSILRIWYGDGSFRPFVTHRSPIRIESAYLIMEFIEPQQGKMLQGMGLPKDPVHRHRLFSSLAEILADLSRIPLPRIGAFTVGNSGEVTLTGRPLTAGIVMLEADGVPGCIYPGTTYGTTGAYLDDLLSYHEARLEHQRNAVRSEVDAKIKMATLVMLRALQSRFVDRNAREGPFVLQITDLHECNLFVDAEYNITALVDLEWACSLPPELLELPCWLSENQILDLVDTDTYVQSTIAFKASCSEFLEILGHVLELHHSSSYPSVNIKASMQGASERQSQWYFRALKHPLIAHDLFQKHIQPLFEVPNAGLSNNLGTVAQYYIPSSLAFVNRKVEEKKRYDQALLLLCRGEEDADRQYL